MSRSGPAPARLEVIALEGIPEVRPGDDLAALVGDALERTVGVLPLEPDDVLVVTQKVVSKAEGAFVDLAAIEPRPEAIAYAARWGRDARQVEVVLRQAVALEHSDPPHPGGRDGDRPRGPGDQGRPRPSLTRVTRS